MTCEFCGKSRMDVMERTIKEVTVFISCVPCIREIDNTSRELFLQFAKELENKLKLMMKYPGGVKKDGDIPQTNNEGS